MPSAISPAQWQAQISSVGRENATETSNPSAINFGSWHNGEGEIVAIAAGVAGLEIVAASR
ncbi:MAG TPA: hypothetical protein VK747_13455, partial [Blastocatellia bacterium]|nr:hypothetical protein [Blastocatellia bacterium]